MKIILPVIALIILLSLSVPSFSGDNIDKADKLNQLGLFKGTDNGYELDKTFTRAQGATMLVRLLGKESEALAVKEKSRFEDVADDNWAVPYVNYCVTHGITKGTGDTTFSPDNEITGAEYITLLMRSLGYVNVNPDNVDIAAAEYGLMSSEALRNIESQGAFTRNEMVNVSYQALNTMGTDGKTLLENLIENGVVSKSLATKLGILKDESKNDIDDYINELFS